MQYNFRGMYDSTKNYLKKDVVSYQPTVNDPIKYYFCLADIVSTSPQTPSTSGDTAYWGLINAQSNFPNSVDTFLYRSPIQESDKADISRIEVLNSKSTLTVAEQDELNNLIIKQRDKFFLADDANALQQSVSNLQMFFKDKVDSKLNENVTTINQSKEDALLAIEQKKNNVIEYMDSTTAGALRNDIGVMGDLQTTDKTSLVTAVNEVQSETNKAQNEIGILSELQTTDKTNLVAAINEVKNNSSSSAADTSITDAGGYFNSANAEGALQEIGQTLNAMRGNLITSANNILGA